MTLASVVVGILSTIPKNTEEPMESFKFFRLCNEEGNPSIQDTDDFGAPS